MDFALYEKSRFTYAKQNNLSITVKINLHRARNNIEINYLVSICNVRSPFCCRLPSNTAHQIIVTCHGHLNARSESIRTEGLVCFPRREVSENL